MPAVSVSVRDPARRDRPLQAVRRDVLDVPGSGLVRPRERDAATGAAGAVAPQPCTVALARTRLRLRNGDLRRGRAKTVADERLGYGHHRAALRTRLVHSRSEP